MKTANIQAAVMLTMTTAKFCEKRKNRTEPTLSLSKKVLRTLEYYPTNDTGKRFQMSSIFMTKLTQKKPAPEIRRCQ